MRRWEILDWPHPIYLVMGSLMIVSGMIFLWFLVFADTPSSWSRAALYLQVIVLFFATLLLPLTHRNGCLSTPLF